MIKKHPIQLIILFLLMSIFSIQFGCQKKPSVESKLPNVELKDLGGRTVNLASFKGQPILINFWATWCGPCRIEIPMLNELHRKYGKNLTIIGISTDDDPEAAIKEFIREVPIEYQNLIKTPSVDEGFGGIWALPTSYFYDKDGNQVEKIIGLQTREFFEKTIQKTLKN
jgi:thiol-disulfide isomerase/thioredoxin